jgi:hypothetical protein
MPANDGKGKNRQYLTINDFSPGIYDRGLYSGSQGRPAPIGAAQGNGATFGCLCLPKGGLGPGPKKVTTFAVPDPDAGNYASGPIYVGMGNLGPVIVSPTSQYPDEIFLGIEWITTNTGVRRFRQYRLRLFDSPYGNDNLLDVTTTSTSATAQFWGQTWTSSRMATTSGASPSTNFTDPGQAVYVTEWSEVGLGGVKYINTYPNPRTPSTNVMTSTLLQGSTAPATSRPGQIIGHQNRIVLLEDINNVHPSTNSGAIPTNEQISFTDPANSNTPIGTQKQVFVAEYPNGYGAWGSISAGELFLVKNQGGGVVVSGDIASPTVTRLPGVVSTGAANAYYKAASTPKGLFYLTTQQGAWVWRGSDTAQKISEQLDDNFAVTPNSAAINNVRGQLSEWADWVVFPNNWLYDTQTDSWWNLNDRSIANGRYDFYVRSFSARYMYAISAQPASASTGVVDVYDRLTPANTYTWKSQPIVLPGERLFDVREVHIVAQGNGTVAVTVSADGTTGASSSTTTFSPTSTTAPVKMRDNLSALGESTVIVTIVSTGQAADVAAPVVYEVTLGYDDRAHATLTP